jgi:hypothetical protein
MVVGYRSCLTEPPLNMYAQVPIILGSASKCSGYPLRDTLTIVSLRILSSLWNW